MIDPVLSFDFGGTKLAAALIDAASGKIYARVRRQTPTHQGAVASLEEIIEAGREVLQALPSGISQINGVGVSFGGPVSKDRRTVLRSMHIDAWESFDLPAQLEKVFGKPAYMDNDANAAALGEWHFGAGKGASDMVYIQVSTGIGAGLILNSRVYRGSGLAGEFGHLTVKEDGPLCACGKHGCVESLASGWAIARQGRSVLETGATTLLRDLCNNRPYRLDAEMVLRACQVGDQPACRIIESAFKYLALGIANVIMLVDPQIVVLGGGVTRSRDIMKQTLDDYIPQFLPPMFIDRTQIAYSDLQGQETLLGAALLPRGF